ncbi:ADP-dependent glucokinase-like [Babylonia areolata]|uniref:ADP-dependent glucokinase-like n=1 Tax=Babylonia areolata TaxID=304850 RepID=UPI003FCFE95D
MGTATRTLCFGITTVLVSYFYLRWYPQSKSDLDAIEKQVAEVWNTDIKYPAKPFARLAVGTNADVDLIVSGVELLKKLMLAPGKEENHNSLTSLSDLQETFSFFFSKGRAAERIVTDPAVYKQIVKTVFDLEHVEQHIGGNAALMAMIISSLFPEAKVQFVGPVGPILQSLMPVNVSVPASSLMEQDEFHLIMEYKVGEEWGAVQAPVANRFICSHDESNLAMTMAETFFASLPTFDPDLVVLSGLHMLEGLPPDHFQARIDVLASGLTQLGPGVPVHLEFASMANAGCMKSILEKVLPQITSLGLNEQELAFTSQAMGGRHSEQLNQWEGQPPIHIMGDLVHWLLDTFGQSSSRPHSRLTRVHFHSLTFHVVGVHRSHWSNVVSATMAGTRIAGLQACDIQDFHPDSVDLRIPLEFQLHSGDQRRQFDAAHPAYSWSIGEFDFVFSPVLVCKNPIKTVGLGDAISATGLMFSQYSP